MSTIVYQGTIQPSSSCYESQLITHEPRSLTLKLSSPSTSSKLNFSECFDHQQPAHKPPSSSSSNSGMFEYNWGCIQSLPAAAIHREHDQKTETSRNDVYIHPLIKKSSSLLDKKSLEMCTENLGSETGSETAVGSNSHSSSIPSSPDHLDSHSSIPLFHHQILTDVVLGSNDDDDSAEIHSANYSMKSSISSSSSGRINNKKSVVVKNNYRREFPPPLTTISGPNSIHVKRQCMEGGRLVIETIAAPPRHSYMQAERSDGRLRLTLTTTHHANDDYYYYSDLDEPAADEDDILTSASSWFNQRRRQPDDEDVNVVGGDQEEVEEQEMDARRRNHVVSADHHRQVINSSCCGDVGVKNGINEDSFQRLSRCKEGDAAGAGGRGHHKTLNTWESFWVATS